MYSSLVFKLLFVLLDTGIIFQYEKQNNVNMIFEKFQIVVTL